MAYTKQIWEDLPEETTPINATRLSHMEQGIYDAYALATPYSSGQMSAADKTKLNEVVKPYVDGTKLKFITY